MITAPGLKAAIEAQMSSATFDPVNNKDAFLNAMCVAIVSYLQANIVVNVTGTTASGCSSGGAVGTCVATGTIS